MMKTEKDDVRFSTAPSTNSSTATDSTTASSRKPVHGILIGRLDELSDGGQALVTYPDNLAVLPIAARSTVQLTPDAVGKEVALLFENGDISCPIVVGVLQNSAEASVASDNERTTTVHPADEADDSITIDDHCMTPSDSELIVDGRRIDLQAREQIVLRCGKSSITMTRAGKVIIRGTYVSSKSSGANRIKGGSVQIN